MLIRRTKLVADIGADARFNPARTQSDQGEAAYQSDARVVNGEHEVPNAVNNRKAENGSKLSKNSVSQKSARQRQKINGGDKGVIPGFRLMLAEVIGMPLSIHHVFSHEDHKDGIHPVVTEALSRLVAPDVGNTWRHSTGFVCSRGVFGFRHSVL